MIALNTSGKMWNRMTYWKSKVRQHSNPRAKPKSSEKTLGQ